MILLYAIWYGAGRAVIEGLRTDSLMIPNTSLRASQVLAIVLVGVAVVIWSLQTSKVKKEGKHLFVDSEEGQRIVRGEFHSAKDKQEQPETKHFPGNTEGNVEEGAEGTEHFPGNTEGNAEGNTEEIAETEKDFPGNDEEIENLSENSPEHNAENEETEKN